MPKTNRELIKRFYLSLLRIRWVEEEIIKVYPTDKIKSPVHLSIGQEAVAVGVCETLYKGDIVFGTYRGHAMYLAKGGNLNAMIAELYGKEAGCAKGKGGSMHLIDVSCGVMGTSAIVGTTIPISLGYAMALMYKGSRNIVVSFFGDGAVDEGAFHESMNFAVIKKAPVLFVCENNAYAIHSHHLSRHHSDNVFERAKAYGMPSERISDGNIFKLYEAARRLIDRIRRGGGPAFLECDTCRWKEHVGPGDDFSLGYRSTGDVAEWKKRDPLIALKNSLGAKTVARIEDEIAKEIEAAFAFAETNRFPRGSVALSQDLFAP